MSLLQKHRTPCAGICPSQSCPYCMKAPRLVGYAHSLYINEGEQERFRKDFAEYKRMDAIGTFTVDAKFFGDYEDSNYYYCTSIEKVSEDFILLLFPYLIKVKLNDEVIK